MATTGTYSFSPTSANIILNAFGRIKIRRTEVTQQHLEDAVTEANLLQVEFSNRQPNLWKSELYPVALTEAVESYTLLARFISPMAVYLTSEDSSGNSTDRILYPLSTYEYAALPNKLTSGPPTSYWYNRQATPVIKLYPVPDGQATYTLNLQILSQPEDVGMRNGTTLDFPYRWIDAFTAALAARLAAIYAQDLEDRRKIDAERAWQFAAGEDIEYTPLYIMPGLNGYYT